MTATPPGPAIATFRSASPGTLQALLTGAVALAPGELLLWVSLGANLPLHPSPSGTGTASIPGQPPTLTLIQALHALHPTCPVLALSSLWRTQPVDQPSPLPDQLPPPVYVNACALLRTSLPVEPILALTQQLELRFGRIRDPQFPKGPRTLDLDLLLALAPSLPGPPAPVLRDTPALQLPHPSMHRRRFVLAPLAEIAPTLRHPRLHQSVDALLHALGPITPEDAVTRLDPPEWPALPCGDASRDIVISSAANSTSPS